MLGGPAVTIKSPMLVVEPASFLTDTVQLSGTIESEVDTRTLADSSGSFVGSVNEYDIWISPDMPNVKLSLVSNNEPKWDFVSFDEESHACVIDGKQLPDGTQITFSAKISEDGGQITDFTLISAE